MSVRFRKDRNKWQASFIVRGVRHRPLFDTKREADDADRAAKKKKFEIDEVVLEKIEIAAGFKMYFDDESTGKSNSSRLNDRRYFNLAHHYLTDERGLVFLEDIQLQDLEGLQRWYLKEQDLGAGEIKEAWNPATVNRAFHTLKRFFNKMCAWGKLAKSPAHHLQLLSERPAKRATLTREMYDAMLVHHLTPTWFKDVLQFVWLTGARGSSIARLTWDRVDLRGRRLELDTQKGAKAETKLITLPLTDELFALLVRLRNRWPTESGVVFRYDNGRPVRADVISKWGTRSLKNCGIVGIVLYGARHGLASELMDAGVDMEIVRQLLGHSSVKTTQNYTKGTKLETLKRAVALVRGDDVAPTGTKPENQIAVASGDSE